MVTRVFCALLALATTVLAPASAAEAPPIFVGGAFIRERAILDERGHVLVPVRGIFEAVGARVTYTPPKFVVVRKNGIVVAGLIVGRSHAVVGNRPRSLGVAPVRRDGRIYVPLRVIAEIAGASVVYSAKPRVVDIRLPVQYAAASVAGSMPVGPVQDDVPLWLYVLVGLIVAGLIVELARQAAVARRHAKRPMGAGYAALTAASLQLPNATGSGDQNRIGQPRK